MKLTKNEWLHTGRWIGQWLIVMSLLGMAWGEVASAQAVSTTTVQGTVYLANGRVGAGTLDVNWPAFTTSNSQAITAGRVTVTIGQDGFVSVNLAPNLGATPAGLYYTAIYHMSDGTTSTEYWVVPAAAQASLGQVRAQLMPSSQAVQAVSKAYVDQSITELTQSLLTASGGTLSGPLYLNGDPTQALQAADKHYVDSAVGLAVPLAGGSMTGALATPTVNGVQAPVAGSTQTTIQAAVSAAGTSGAVEIPPTYTGSDGFTNPNGVYVTDLRQTGAQQFERSVKEFGAVCDGTTDDTNALQSALNYAQTHGVALTIPQGTCKTRMLSWRGESIGGMGKQVSALMGFPGQDVLATATDSTNLLANTRLHDLTIYVDQSMDVSCSAAEGRASAGSCTMSRLLESNSIFSPGGNGQTGAVGTGTAWAVGNCAIAMPAATGTSGNGLRLAEIENLGIVATGTDPLAQYTGAHSTHTCGLYLAQWPQWSEFRNIDIRGLNTGIAMPALPGTTPAGLNADSNRWQNITIQATHGFTAAAGSNNVLDNVVVVAGNSAATGEPPTGLVLDLTGTQQGWTVRNAVALPSWNVVTPTLTVTAAGGAVTAVTTGTEKGLGFDPYGTTVPLKFSGSCTATAFANVKSDGSIGTISVTQGGVGCSGTTTASVNVDGTWDTAAPVNLIAGQNMTLFGGNLQKGNGGYTVWNAVGSRSSGTLLGGGGGTLPGGGSYAGLVGSSSLGSTTQVDQFPGTDFGAKLQACLGAVSTTYGGTCDARNFTGNLSMASNLTVSTANVTVLLPCATISTGAQVIVTAGTRNVALRGCALRGASTASGSQGGTVFLYSGTGAMVQVGDPTYAADTMGFHLDNVVINTTASSSANAQGLTAYRTQEMDLESLYFLGNQNQTGMTLDGTGNYTGGTFFDDAFNGFQTAVNAIGHQVSNAATTDWMNASAFVRLHIDCPTSAGNPISGTYGINLQQGDGNTFTGGDVESCTTALHLGANAQNNTIIGLRNENSTNQVVADAGSSYNNWMTGGTMFTGQLTDNGTRNSFMDTFHRSFNGIKGDWYGSQQDATVTNHYRIGIGAGNERGLLNRYQTDYGYRWTTGLSDATAGEQFFQVLDELNNVNRLSIGQYNNGQSSTNNQTVINAAGTGAIVLNGSNNAGTGGVIIGSGGASESTVAAISNAGNAQFNGTLQVGGASTFTGSTTVKNQANAEIDQFLWAGTTASQKESFTYKDYNGSSQWYMVKDANNNWALNSAVGGLDSLKAYQSGNSGDTYINTSNSSGVIRLNYESGSSGKTYIYGGISSSLIAAFSGTTAIAFPGLAASSGHNCLQIDNSGYISNTGSSCGTGTGGTNGTVSSGNAGQIAYYAANGTALSGTSAVPVTAGGTGATTQAGALASIGAQPVIPGLSGDGQGTPGVNVAGNIAAGTSLLTPQVNRWFEADDQIASCTVGGVAYTTALDCTVAQAKAYKASNHVPVGIRLGCGTYPTNVGIQLTADDLNSISIRGCGKGEFTNEPSNGGAGTVIQAASALTTAVITYPYLSTSLPTPYWSNVDLEGFTVDANGNAPACFDGYALRVAKLAHLSCKGAIGSDHWFLIGDVGTAFGRTVPSGYNGSSLNVMSDDIFLYSNSQGGAVITPVFESGGAITSYTVVSGGLYQNHLATIPVSLAGWQATGTKATPCDTMPTGVVANLSAIPGNPYGLWQVTSVSQTTGGTNCSGTIYAVVPDSPAAAYGYVIAATDSTHKDLQDDSVGLSAGILDRQGYNSAYIHPHVWAANRAFETWGHSDWYSPECDGLYLFCFNFQYSGNQKIVAPKFTYSSAPGSWYGASSSYYFGASPNITLIGEDCGLNLQTAGGYQHFVAPFGPFVAGKQAYPLNLQVIDGHDCGTNNIVNFSGPTTFASVNGASYNVGLYESANDSARHYRLLATLPADNTNNVERIHVRAIGGGPSASTTNSFDIVAGNRGLAGTASDFAYAWNLQGGYTSGQFDVQAYWNADTTVSLYAVMYGNFSAGSVSLDLMQNTPGIALSTIYPNPADTTTVPTGTLVFDTGNPASYPYAAGNFGAVKASTLSASGAVAAGGGSGNPITCAAGAACYVEAPSGQSLYFGANGGVQFAINSSGQLYSVTGAAMGSTAYPIGQITTSKPTAVFIGTPIASAIAVAPTTPAVHITGTTAIATITPPSGCTTPGTGCTVTLIPDGLWTTTTGGNIAIASTAVVSKPMAMTYDPATSKWYPSY